MSEDLAESAEHLLAEKGTKYKRVVNPDQLLSLGITLNWRVAYSLPGSKSPLNHHIFLLFKGTKRVVILAYSHLALKGVEERDRLEDLALRLSEREPLGVWQVIQSRNQVTLILKATLTLSGEEHLQNLLWATCGSVDAAFKSREKEMRIPMPELSEMEVQGLVKQLLNKVGFRKIKEMSLPKDIKAYLVVLSNESDSVEDCWKRFPMRFEVEKRGVVTLRVYFSLNDKAHVFDRNMWDAVNRVTAKLNSHIPEGCYIFESHQQQVHLLFKLVCSRLHEEGIRVLLQNYYEAAICVYKWSAWSFVQLVQKYPTDIRRISSVIHTGDLNLLIDQGLERSPNDRKCIVLNYTREPCQFTKDTQSLSKLSSTPAFKQYLLHEPFIIVTHDECVKVYTDMSLRPLEDAFREGMSAGMLIQQKFSVIMRLFEEYSVFPALKMMKFRPSPLRLLVIPDKGFLNTSEELYKAFQRMVVECCMAAEQQLVLTPEVSLLYLDPTSFRNAVPADIHPLITAQLAGDSYLLWRFQIPHLTRRLVTYFEGYRAEVNLVCETNSIEGLIATEDDRFESPFQSDNEYVNRFYLVERYEYVALRPRDCMDIAGVRQIVGALQTLHNQGLFHGLVSPLTIRTARKREYFLCMPCLHWKYVWILYSVIPPRYAAYLAPDMSTLCDASQPVSIPMLQSYDVYSFARLLIDWFPLLKHHAHLQAALSLDWRMRPTLTRLMKTVEEEWNTLCTERFESVIVT